MKNRVEMLADNFENCIKYNQFFEYLYGVGNYNMVLKDSSITTNNPYDSIRGINKYCEKNSNFNVNEFIKKSTLDLINSNDIVKNASAIEFISTYIKVKSNNQLLFDLNVLDYTGPIINKLKQQKEKMLVFKNENYTRDEGMWGIVSSNAEYIEQSSKLK